jgi:acetolactate synthase I/III small subunit
VGVSKFTIVVNIDEVNIKKIIGQIEKQVEVIKAYYHNLDQIIYQISGLFKIKSELLFEEPQIQNIIKESNARIVTVNKAFFILEKSGRKEEIVEMYNQLSKFGIMQYTRSGLIAVTKEEMKISSLLESYNN